MRYVIVSDIPAPWREPVFERVHQRLAGSVDVVFFNANESRRLWTFPKGAYPRTILKSIRVTRDATERFLNPGLVPYLLRRRPTAAVVFASIKDPSGWIAMGLCRAMGTRVALLDDSWMGRERGIGRLQRQARHLVYRRFGDAFVGASMKTLEMHQHYNPAITGDQCFLSHLVVDNAYFRDRLATQQVARDVDVMFSGRIVDVKNPEFFARVCAAVRQRTGRCRALIIGEGEQALKARMRGLLDEGGVDYEFAGFVPHANLPEHYARARVLLLPTAGDCWGVVINEAMAAGTPVVTTEWTAAAGELVVPNRNGFVLPLEVDMWADAIVDLISEDGKWDRFSQQAREDVAHFSYERAADGLIAALAYLDPAGPASVAQRVDLVSNEPSLQT